MRHAELAKNLFPYATALPEALPNQSTSAAKYNNFSIGMALGCLGYAASKGGGVTFKTSSAVVKPAATLAAPETRMARMPSR